MISRSMLLVSAELSEDRKRVRYRFEQGNPEVEGPADVGKTVVYLGGSYQVSVTKQ